MSRLPGGDLRDCVADLLRVKFQNVEVEKRIVTTTADVLFVDDTNPIFPRKIAVETKDWKAGLTSTDIAEIHSLYSPALTNRVIDHLWIIGRHPLSGSPKSSVDALANVKYSTFEEFRASLINFTPILQHNILAFEQHEAAKFFIETRVRNKDQKLFDYVSEWLISDKHGLVVFGGYGLGKTTFSLYVASVLSKKYLEGSFDRIPVRIPLGGMYSKQDVVALICSALSGSENGVSVKDFSFTMFLEMSRQGQFLLILDGFDEMRHAMDIEDFVYTFEEMKPLLRDKAKVVILGRPDSFLSNVEEERILSSLFDEDVDRKRRLKTVEVAFFNKSEVDAYLSNFLTSRADRLSDDQYRRYVTLLDALPDTEDNILLRPVQLRMFTSIIEEFIGENAPPFNRYALYKRFIYRFIVRESRKWARQPPAHILNSADLRDDRMTFMQAVAWWLLNTKKENKFYAEEVPIDIVPAGLRVKRNNEAAIREALVGSVIEPVSQSGVLNTKANRFYFFPHKSYLEFLIADYFENARFKREEYRSFMANVNAEILSFIEEGPGGGVSNLREGLMHDLGTVDARILEVCAKDARIASEIVTVRSDNHHPSKIYTHYFYLRQSLAVRESYLLARLADSATVNSALATYNCIADELRRTHSKTLAVAIIVNAITNISHHRMTVYLETGQPIDFYQASIESLRAAVLADCVKCSRDKIVLLAEPLSRLVEKAARASLFVNFPVMGVSSGSVSLMQSEVQNSLGAEYHELFKRMIVRARETKKLCSIRLLSDAADRFG